MSTEDRHLHMKIKIAITGAAETGHCGASTLEAAKELGRQVVEHGGILINGATTGVPLWSAIGAKEAGGMVVGLSPASTEEEHVHDYKLPLEYMDLIIYTGSGYSGRDLLMTRTSDAIVLSCGRIGTIHEFTIAFEDNKPIGILEGEWPTDEVIRNIIENSNRAGDNLKVVFDRDPKTLLDKIFELVRRDKEGNK